MHHLDAEIRENYFPVPVPDDVAICAFKFIEKGNNIAFMNVGRESCGESFLPFSHVYYFFGSAILTMLLGFEDMDQEPEETSWERN